MNAQITDLNAHARSRETLQRARNEAFRQASGWGCIWAEANWIADVVVSDVHAGMDVDDAIAKHVRPEVARGFDGGEAA